MKRGKDKKKKNKKLKRQKAPITRGLDPFCKYRKAKAYFHHNYCVAKCYDCTKYNKPVDKPIICKRCKDKQLNK